MHLAHISVKRHYASGDISSACRTSHNAQMERQRTYLREWRKAHQLSLVVVAEMVGLTQPHLGRIETGKNPYNQDLLEALATIYGCTPDDLLTRHPDQPKLPDNVAEIVRSIPRENIEHALAVLSTFAKKR